ncbi:MAG: class I SAM-dependent methyltransferase, partial [Lachnospirales bacterium]
DYVAKSLLTDDEYKSISENMSKGIEFFNKDFKGSKDEALKLIVDNYLSPTPLGRSVYSEKILEISVKTGTLQYIILGTGYDTFSYRQKKWAEKLEIFEIDRSDMIEDKIMRLKRADILVPNNVHYIKWDFTDENLYKKITENENFNKNKITFCNISGLVYYMTELEFENIINNLSSVLKKGSAIFFDYPNKEKSEKNEKNKKLAEGANEKMKFCLYYSELEKLLEKYDFLIYEHLNSDEITKQYFNEYNKENPNAKICEHKNVSYCLCVKGR